MIEVPKAEFQRRLAARNLKRRYLSYAITLPAVTQANIAKQTELIVIVSVIDPSQ